MDMLKHLIIKEIGCTGTIKGNTWQNYPLPSKNGFIEKPKGSSVGYFDSWIRIELVLWNDNGAVNMGSNFKGIESTVLQDLGWKMLKIMLMC